MPSSPPLWQLAFENRVNPHFSDSSQYDMTFDENQCIDDMQVLQRFLGVLECRRRGHSSSETIPKARVRVSDLFLKIFIYFLFFLYFWF